MKKIKINYVQCIKPATGISQGGVEFANKLAATVAFVGIPFSLIPGVGPVITMCFEGAAFTTEFGKWIAENTDSTRHPDQLYINVNKNRIWPSPNGHQDVIGGQTVYLNQEFDMIYHPAVPMLGFKNAGYVATIELYDYDKGSADDLLGGKMILTDNFADGRHTIIMGNPDEDSLYSMEIEIY